MTMIAAAVDAMLRAAGIPITGVSVPDPENKLTWVVQFAEEATTSQRTQAGALITAYVVDPDVDIIAAIEGNKALKAVVIWAAGKLSLSPATARAQIIAIYKTL